MPGREHLRWITLNDFSPGIQQRLMFAGGSTAPVFQLGAATEDTYRCYALPQGGLGPLPRRDYEYTPAYPQNPASGVVNSRLTVSGFHIAGPLVGAGIEPVEFHVAYEYILTGGGTARRYRWQRHRIWESSPTVDAVKELTGGESGPSQPSVRPTWFDNFRAHASDATMPGTPLVSAAWYEGGGGNQRFWSVFPKLSTPTTTSFDDISTSAAYELVHSHQGRSVAFQQQAWDHPDQSWAFNEQIWFTNANLITLQNAVAQVFGQDNSTGYAVVGSTNVNELLLIKQQGGGFVARGDIANPSLLRLPGLPSPGNFIHQGSTSPIGFVYMIRNGGAWVWSGGEDAQFISPQLEGDVFSNGISSDFLDYRGRIAYFRDWIFFPNNWVYDWRNNSWWKIENPATVRILQWSTQPVSSVIWGVPASITSTSTVLAHRFDYAEAARSYKWTSQPLSDSIFRDIKVREVILVAQGSGTVTITLRKLDGTTTTQTFTVSSTTFPTKFRQNFSADGTHVQVIIEADGSSNPAPIVYEVHLGLHDDHQQPVKTS